MKFMPLGRIQRVDSEFVIVISVPSMIWEKIKREELKFWESWWGGEIQQGKLKYNFSIDVYVLFIYYYQEYWGFAVFTPQQLFNII